MATISISFDMFDSAETADFGPIPLREAWGQVVTDDKGCPVVKQIENRFYVWMTNIYNGHQFAWSVSKFEGERLQNTIIGGDGLRFRVFETDRTYVDDEGQTRYSTAQEISNLRTGEIVWKLPDSKQQ